MVKILKYLNIYPVTALIQIGEYERTGQNVKKKSPLL